MGITKHYRDQKDNSMEEYKVALVNPTKQDIEKAKKEVIDEIRKTSKKAAKKTRLRGNLSTGADLIDLVLEGGYPYGIINIIGDSNSGKSFLSGEFLAISYHALNGKVDWFYDDCEKGYRFNSKKLYNLDILNKGFFPQKRRSHTIEDFERKLQEIIDTKEKGKPFIYVLDSFDSITTEAEIKHRKQKLKPNKKSDEEKDTKSSGSYNLEKQKEGHAIFRTRVREIEENNILLIVVSQVKMKIGVSFGYQQYRTGGKSLDFYPNIIFWLAEAEKYKKKNRAVGYCMKVRGQKTRSDKPFRECYIDLLFDYGIDNISSNLKFLYDLKTAKGKNAEAIKKNIVWDDNEYSFDGLMKFIEDNDLEAELKQRTVNKWNAIEAEISSDHRKRKWG